jgi:BolA protein
MRRERIEQALTRTFPQSLRLEITDESHLHAGRAGQESHFKLLIVDSGFAGVSRVERQRQINDLLKQEFSLGLHALSFRLLTPEEAEASGEFRSPNCQGSRSPC